MERTGIKRLGRARATASQSEPWRYIVRTDGASAKGMDLKRMKRTWRKGDSIESIVSGIFLVVGRLVVREPMFPRDASPGAAGFSYPIKSSLLELGKLRGVETSPVERALARCGPVYGPARPDWVAGVWPVVQSLLAL